MQSRKLKYVILGLFSLLFAQLCLATNYKQSDFRNYFGLAWTSNAEEILTYSKNVGHTHVMYQHGMERNPKAAGMTYYIETPEYGTYERTIDLRKKYPAEKIKMWESICAVAFPEKPFPENMATGWFFNDYVVSLQLDMQQKAVHERTIAKIMEKVQWLKQLNPKFKFGGFSWDVPQPYGDFNEHRDNKWFNHQVTLKHWTGSDSTPEHAGIKHDYKTYFEGYFEFYHSLMVAARKMNPDAKFVVEPFHMYKDWVSHYDSDFFKSKGDKAKDYIADFMWCEGHGTDFLDDSEVYASGLVKKSDVGSSCPHSLFEKDVRAVMGACARDGAWACFFGRYGGYDVSPRVKSIRDIPSHVKLGKLIPTWENLHNTPLSERSFDGAVYSSPTAYMSEDVYWAIQPQRNRIIAVFNNMKGEVKLPEGFKIKDVAFLDGLFTPCGLAGKKFVTIGSNSVKLADDSIKGWAFEINFEKIPENKQ